MGSETQTDLSRTDETQDLRCSVCGCEPTEDNWVAGFDPKKARCERCRKPKHPGVHEVMELQQAIDDQSQSAELTRLRAERDEDLQLIDELQKELSRALHDKTEMDAERDRLRAEVERLELRESVLMATVDKLETELQMWRGSADENRGYVVRPKVDPMF